MGRRSINTTKSGKYMNPTDQARKEARKKELKKNKKQRQMVRAAVLKNKDPAQILEEMEKIDEMEYNVLQPSPLNEKVLRDKRKKLKETFERVMRLYQAEEPELWSDLKRKEIEYEKKRLKKQQYYESVKHAQSVQVDEIPLPSSTQAPPNASGAFGGGARLPPPPSSLSLPPFAPGAPPSALKRPSENLVKLPESSDAAQAKDRSGVPVGPPPDLFSMPELDTDAEDDEVTLKKYVPKSKKKSVSKPNTLQQRMLAISGQNIDDFMKEMENVHKKKEKERQAAKRKHEDRSDDEEVKSFKGASDDDDDDEDSRSRGKYSDSEDESGSDSSHEKSRKEKPLVPPKLASTKATPSGGSAPPVVIPLPPAPSGVPPHMPVPGPPMPPVAGLAPPMLYRPPPLRPPSAIPTYGIRMPPGPPTVPRPRPPMSGPPRMGIRMPPGPPPGLPPRLAQQAKQNQLQQQQLLKDASKGVTTITAKPQIRNLSADVTRFVPSTLRVKREETRKTKPNKTYAPEQTSQTAETSKGVTKDDAYMQFMNEMQGLL